MFKMISYPIYNFIHLFGIFLVTLSFGMTIATFYGLKRPKWVMAFHGIGLFLILLGGFGMAARLGFVRDFPVWIQFKIGFWVLVGFLPLVLKILKFQPRSILLAQMLFLLLGAAFGIFKPQLGA